MLIPLFDTLANLNVTQPVADIQYPDDFRLAREFLYSYRGSEATFNAYRREIERLLHWSWEFQEKSIRYISRADFEAFVEFCQRPPREWIGLKQAPRFRNQSGMRIANDQWRPFVATVSKAARQAGQVADVQHYTLSQKALQAIFSILGSFYSYLLQEAYVDANPVAQIRQKSKFIRKQQNQTTVRRLSELQWAYVIETAEYLAVKDPAQHERTLFIMNALYAMYLRISELAASTRWEPQMGDFKRDNDDNWWFTTVGKGNKERSITVSDAMLNALRRYRRFLGLAPLPSPGETLPLIMKTRGPGAINSTRQIRNIVQTCFDIAIERMTEDGFNDDAQMLGAATVHWLRHTGISEDVKHRPREHVRDDAGHGSSAITDRYVDVELQERHASARKKKIKPD